MIFYYLMTITIEKKLKFKNKNYIIKLFDYQFKKYKYKIIYHLLILQKLRIKSLALIK